MSKASAKELFISKYLNSWKGGLIRPDRQENDNGVQIHACFIVLLHLNRMLEKEDKSRFKECVENTEKKQGLYHRSPLNKKAYRNSTDNVMGTAVGSVLCGLDFHSHILEYGRKHFWCYNNLDESFNLKSCIQGGDVALLKIYNKQKPNFLELGWLNVGLRVSDTSWLTWMRLVAAHHVGFKTQSTVAWMRRWAGQQELHVHLGNWYGAKHPFVELSKGVRIK